MSYTAEFPIGYIPNPDKFGALAGGDVYFGVPNGSPATVPGDRIQVYAARQGLSDLAINQPIDIGPGGEWWYNGQPVQIKVLVPYCVQVMNSLGVQKYYAPAAGDEIAKFNAIDDSISDLSDEIDSRVKTVDSFGALTSTVADIGRQVIVYGDQWGIFDVVSASGHVADAGMTAINGAIAFIRKNDYVTPEMFGAKRDGVTDDTLALNRACATQRRVVCREGAYFISDTIEVYQGCIFEGQGSGCYDVQGSATRVITEFIVKTNSTNLGIQGGSKSLLQNFLIRPENSGAVPYFNATYPAGTGNCEVGVYSGFDGGSAYIHNVTALAFSKRGIVAGVVTRVSYCCAFFCEIGIYGDGSDGWIKNSVGMFCHEAGFYTDGNYWNISGNRAEWNGKYGFSLGGETAFNGNTMDRNGWAGAFHRDGAWGSAHGVNYYARNGVGGDGSLGRWAFSVPGHPSYIATPKEESCHIKINFQRALAITGNRFRSGRDDTGGGASGPCYIYSSTSAPGATTPNEVNICGNIGDSLYANVLGFEPAMYGNSGAVAGGTDTNLSRYINAMAWNRDNKINVISPSTSASSSATVEIDVPVGTSGEILLASRTAGGANLSKIYFYCNAIGTGLGASFTEISGTNISAAAIANVDARINRVTITLVAASFSSYYTTVI